MRFVALMLAGGLAGCSSVPDVTFADDAGVVVPAVEDAGARDAAAPDAAPAAEGVRCPERPPPAGEGICCGARLCLRCNALQCATCDREGCKVGEVCCARGTGLGGGNMSCTAPTGCN